jgi:diadenosine tetraphosphatase ApaH/serine/threonine PP2A family protein phosphatase
VRYLILSDIHSNTEALSAVLAFVHRKHWDRTVFLGDIVGYGAHPNQALDRLRGLRRLVGIRGNHDKVCSGLESGEMFNRIALAAAMWTKRRLRPVHLNWLRALPKGPQLVDDAFAACHGTPVDEDAYIFSEIEALNVFRRTDYRVCFFGHSHFPIIFALNPDGVLTTLTSGPAFRFRLEPGARYLINPGSVGQPRDGNPLASFALYDTATAVVTIYRVPYDIQRAQRRILKAGLPKPLADRLRLGR